MTGARTSARVASSSNGSGHIAKQQVLLHDVMAFVRRYVVMSDEQLLVVALWVIHTHCLDSAEQTPYLAVNSPEKECGKSRLLTMLAQLCARAWQTVLPSEAIVYRKINADHPTLLLDEIDTIFSPRTADRYENLRALLNNGNRRGAKVPRCVGPTNKLVEFDTFCAKALAGIGTLPDTVASRSIPIRLERKTREDETERFFHRDIEPPGQALHRRIAKWAVSNGKRLQDARPNMPDELDDRAQEGCEILVAIADLLGCGPQARAALVSLFAGERLDSDESVRERLLRDIRDVFGKRKSHNIFTQTLLSKLYEIDEAPWSRWYGRRFEDRDLAKLLKPYGIKSTTVRIKLKNGKSKVAKGYKRDSFQSAWERYL
jgi:hypothetical protein